MSKSPKLPAVPGGEIVLYQTPDGQTRVECRFSERTIWLTQRLMADLYMIGVNTVNHHIQEIYADGELSPEATIRQYRIVQTEGVRQVERQVDHYSLDMILSVGYRVRSERGVLFRQWATARLQEYLVKGFVMDDERLKNPPGPGVPDYFDELLERIRDIRASERRMYLRVGSSVRMPSPMPRPSMSVSPRAAGSCWRPRTRGTPQRRWKRRPNSFPQGASKTE